MLSPSINLMQRKEKKAAKMMKSAVKRSAVRNPHRSESQPSRVGEKASPKAWMKKILTAKAMARTPGLVTLTITVFNGPVLRNRKNSAKKIAVRHALSDGVISA